MLASLDKTMNWYEIHNYSISYLACDNAQNNVYGVRFVQSITLL